jgi:predicted TPR repeat methyltransferase
MPDLTAILAQAMADHQAGRLDEASRGYRRILRKQPTHPDALHFFGLLHFHRGQGVQAVALIMQSLAHAPGNPHAWNNLGNILSAQDKMTEAKEAYRRVTLLAPKMAEVWYNLAICMRDEGEFDQAAQHFRKAIEQQPDFMRAYEYLGMLLYRVGDYGQAAEVYKAWLVRDPQSPVARHMAAATSGTDIPERANEQYVAKIFDRFAASFDNNLKNLGYRAPEIVATALTGHVGQQATLDILDAGCGTGLCGPLLRPLCRSLTGVDLSPKMLEHARERGGYDELTIGELCEFMRSRVAQFDAVVSADTLVYFGALEEACAAARRSLRNGGLLVFTVEALPAEDPEPYKLQVHGRYTHRASYVREALQQAGFEVLSIAREVLRMERLQEVIGHLVIARVAA